MKTIMIIDNNEVDNFIMEKTLTSTLSAERLYVCTSGLSGLEFIQNLERNKLNDILPEIIFLDIDMPLLDGFQFLKEVKESRNPAVAKIKIAIVTTSLNPEDKDLSLKMGADYYFTKPFNAEYLKELKG